MAITDTQKVDYLFKKVGYSISKTDTSSVKSPSNETISSPLVVRNESVWQQSGSIPSTIPSSSGNIVSVYSDALGNTVQTTADATASTNRTWKTNLTNWIDPSFGSTYQVKVYLATTGNSAPQTYGTQLFADGAGTSDEWFFDYQSGVLNFAGTNLPTQTFTGKSIFISGARYIGLTGYTTISNLTFSGTTISSIGTNANIILTANGAGYIIGGNAIFSSITVNSISLSGAVSSNGQMYINANISSTSYTSGALVVLGGVGVSGDINSNGSMSVTKNVLVNGNITANGVIYTQGYQVLSTNTTITATGDAYGSGLYNNIALTLADTGVTAGVYGSADDIRADRVPRITVDSKGRITNIANISLTQVGNLSFNDTTISTVANLTLYPANSYIFASNSIISNVANPLNSQDVVTVKFLSDKLNANANILVAGDSSIRIFDTGSNGRMEMVIDGRMIANINANTTNLYDTINIANISFTTESITSTSSTGNILLSASGTGIVQVLGSKAVGIPYGTSSNRPSSPITGYLRYNTDLTSIEFWNGSDWITVNKPVTSQIFSGDNSTNAFVLTSSTTSTGVIVTINGTLQQPVTAYVVSGNVITFTETPVLGDSIEVRTLSTTTTVTSLLASDNSSSVLLSSGNVNVTGNLAITGNISVNSINVSDTANVAGNMTVSGQTINLGSSSLGSQVVIKGTQAGALGFQGALVLTSGGMYALSMSEFNGGISINTGGLTTTNSGISCQGGNLEITYGTPSISSTTGALQVTGGAGITGNLYVGGYLTANVISTPSMLANNLSVSGYIQSPYTPVVRSGMVHQGTGLLSLISSPVSSGASPRAMAVDPTGRFVYVGNYTDGTVTLYSINQTTGALISVNTYSSGSNPTQLVCDPTGRFVYVANSGVNTVSMFSINQSTGALTTITTAIATGNTPHGIAVDPTGRFVYVTNYYGNTVSMYSINQSTGALTSITTAIASGTTPESIVVDPTGRFVYVTNYTVNTVSMFSINQVTGVLASITTAIASGSNPSGITTDPTGRFAYVANHIGNTVSMYSINQITGVLTTITTAIASGSGPSGLTTDPNGKFLYVTDSGVSLYSINQTTGALTSLSTIASGSLPWTPICDPTGRFVYVTNATDNTVSMYNVGNFSAGSGQFAGNLTVNGGIVQGYQYYGLNANVLIPIGTGDVRIFSANVFLNGSTFYEFETAFSFYQATIRSSVSLNFGTNISATANLPGNVGINNINYQYFTSNTQASINGGIPQVAGVNNSGYSNIAANTTVLLASGLTATAYDSWVLVKGTLTTSTSGWFSPRIAFSSAPSSVSYIQSGSYFKITPLATVTGTANVVIGTWA